MLGPVPHTATNTDCLSDCTPDELAAMVREIRDQSGLIGPHTYHLVTYKNSFIGRDLVTWLVEKKGLNCECGSECRALESNVTFQSGLVHNQLPTSTYTHTLHKALYTCCIHVL